MKISNQSQLNYLMILQKEKNQTILEQKDIQINIKKIPKLLLKYQLFPFHNSSIKNISLFQNILVFGSGNQSQNIKICISQIENQTIAYKQVQLHHSFNNRHNFIKWSPNGRYLATGSTQIIIWGYENNNFTKFKQFSDELFEITAFTWCPNSNKYAASGVNNNLAIIIRNVETDEKIKQIKNQHKILGLSWDPYDKHLASLLANNSVIIYKCANWEKAHVINLNLQPSKILNFTNKRQQRKIDWSADFRYLLIPALDDKTIPFVVALDRNNQFSIKYIFTGPFTSINTIKFNRNLYVYNNQIINVFAIGDNDGNISIWGIGQKFFPKKPFFLLKSHKSENQLIQDIQWSNDGRILFASAIKKYLITAIIDQQNFGKRLNQNDKKILLQNMYGSIRSMVTVQNEFKIFKFEEDKKNKQGDNQKQKNTETFMLNNNNINNFQNQQLVFTQQKIINRPDGKKKMIPGILVKKNQVQAIQNKFMTQIEQQTKNNRIDTQVMSNNVKKIEAVIIDQEIQKKQYKLIVQQKLNLNILQSQQTYYKIDQHKFMQIQANNNQSKLNIYVNINFQFKQILSKIVIKSKISYVEIITSIIVVYTKQGYLYFFNLQGKPVQLPIFLGKIYAIKINQNFDILYLNSIGQLRSFNIQQKKMYIKTNIFDLISANIQHKQNKQTKQINQIIDFIVFTNQRDVFIQFLNKKLFFWKKQLQIWSSIQNESYQLGISPPSFNKQNSYNLITKREDLSNRNFFNYLLKPPVLSLSQQLQYNLIYYLKHKPDPIKYCNTLLQYIKQLKKQRMDNRLRQLLLDHFIDSSKSEYLIGLDESLLKSIYCIGGQIIQQFKLLRK